MASPSSTAIFVLFLLSATLVLPSHAQLIPSLPLPVTINGLQVAGRLFCSVDGNSCPTCSGLGGVNVTITCNNGTVTVGSLLTNSAGFFNGVLAFATGVLLPASPFPCFATVQLPVANCTLLPPTGILQAPITFLGTLLDGILGLVVQTVVGLWVLIVGIL